VAFAASREQLVKKIDRGEIKDYQGWVFRTRRGCDARNRRYNEKMKSAAVRVSICWRAAVYFFNY
jgi:hypothetical protein